MFTCFLTSESSFRISYYNTSVEAVWKVSPMTRVQSSELERMSTITKVNKNDIANHSQCSFLNVNTKAIIVLVTIKIIFWHTKLP